MGQKFGGKLGDCPVTEDVSDRLLRLPFYNDLSETDQTYVVDTIKEFEPMLKSKTSYPIPAQLVKEDF
jgi:dTDP-4-amino-4,6-dideoxygalactose transaminase